MRKKLFGLLGDRRFIAAILIVIQALILMGILNLLSENFSWIYHVFQAISWIMVIWLIRKEDNPAYKMAWIIVILIFPLFGGVFYLLWGNTPFNRGRQEHHMPEFHPDFSEMAVRPADERLSASMWRHTHRADYIRNITGMPVWGETTTRYFPCGEEQFPAMLEALEEAEHFIFMEYFIIESGEMWNSILDILVRKVKQGVDVRLMYDDAGCISTLPHGYDRYLRSLGIRTIRFNRFIPTLNTYLNYRDHRKITVVDGNVGFMGGINLADEYINRVVRFGYWKDTGVMLRGAGVANMTETFLQMWEYATGVVDTDHKRYLPTQTRPGDGYVQPFGDSPLDDYNVGEMLYMQIINSAHDYVYIATPYLILDNEMITALSTAAQSGVDVRIITPGIPDKKLVYLETRSFYQQLHRAGVRIYEYTPGFLHGKMIVSDDDIAVVGTINMDFRSFFMHFECGTVLYGGKAVKDVSSDLKEIMGMSREIDETWFKNISWPVSILASLLRLFAPLL